MGFYVAVKPTPNVTLEIIQDDVAGLINNGTGLTWTYNDPAGTLTGNVSLSTFSTSDLAEGSNLYFTQARVRSTPLTGFVSGAGSVSASDTVLSAFNKVDGNIALKAPLASPTFTGTATIPTASITNNILFGTDGVGNIGAVGATRPANAYIQSAVFVGANLKLTSSNSNSDAGFDANIGGTGGTQSFGFRQSGAQWSFSDIGAGVDTLTIKSGATPSFRMRLLGTSGAHLQWGTDGGGNIGAAGANRPNNVYYSGQLVVPNNLDATAPDIYFSGSTTDHAGFKFGGGYSVDYCARNEVVLQFVNSGHCGQLNYNDPSNGYVNSIAANSGAGLIYTCDPNSSGIHQFMANGTISMRVYPTTLELYDGLNLTFHTDNTKDIGAAGTLRPRHVNVGTNVVAGGKVLTTGGLGVGNSATATVAVGTLAKKIEVFDASGASLGFIPVYSSIT